MIGRRASVTDLAEIVIQGAYLAGPTNNHVGRKISLSRLAGVIAALLLAQVAFAAPSWAYEWTRDLKEGDSGADVKALQVRVSGWFPNSDKVAHPIDGVFGDKTEQAVKAFQAFYGLPVDGIAGEATRQKLDSLEDSDGTTVHFDWSEFWQNRNSQCSAKANSYAETFRGGKVPARIVKRNVRRLMWRLEALRAKSGDRPIAINSGFRSVAYNECINGATYSQHQYGTAADFRVVDAENHWTRVLGRRSQFHGIGCYASLSHNHMDLRIDNEHLESSRAWWWPERDDEGRDLDEAGKPCWGESARADDSQKRGLIPSGLELRSWKAAGEPNDLHGLD